jgi:hypothetical protein
MEPHMAKRNRIPHLGKLSLAILESHVKTLIGEESIKVLKEPLEQRKFKGALTDAMVKTEQRFIEEHDDKDICTALLDLSLANLPSVQHIVEELYDRPADSSLAVLLKKQLTMDFPMIEPSRIDHAVTNYFSILREELVSIDDIFRQKTIALALLRIQKDVGEITEGERLYKQYSQAPILSQFIRVHEFESLVQERTNNFVGRNFIFRAIDDIIRGSDFPSGYIVIRGEPGIGKTALISELVKRRGYVHHFNLSLQNIQTSKDFLSNICAQLIVHYGLDHFSLPADASKDSGFLSQLLDEVAKKEKSRPTVILVDALDEADDIEIKPAANILYLPQSLPKGIYFILTTRETYDYRLVVDRQKDIYLRDDDPQNIEDVREYVINFLHEHPSAVTPRIIEWNIPTDQFIDVVTEKSEGNFMYLVHVLNDIREGKLTKGNLDNVRNLPKGLKGYYQRHWRMMRAEDEARFDKYQEPVICVLATVREPVTIERVQEWTGLTPRQIRDVINQWREFLNTDESEDEVLYRIYHASFQDFLKDEVGLVKNHEKIAMTALKKIPGFLEDETE